MTSVLMSHEFIISHVPSRNIPRVLSRVYFCVNSLSHHPVSQRSAVIVFQAWEQELALYQNSHIVKSLNIAPLCFPKLFSSFIRIPCVAQQETQLKIFLVIIASWEY